MRLTRNLVISAAQARPAPVLQPAPRPSKQEMAAAAPIVKDMVDTITKERATPNFRATNVKPDVLEMIDFERHARFRVTQRPAGDVLKMTLQLPASGHCGLNDARAWAGLGPRKKERNLYTVRLIEPDGAVHEWKDLPAKGYVTPFALSFAWQPGKTQVEFFPQGSFGVHGFYDGRVMTFEVPEEAGGSGRKDASGSSSNAVT